MAVATPTRRSCGWSLKHKLATLALALATFVGSFFIIPLLGAEFVPKADFSETQVNFYTPVGSSLEVTETRAKQVDAALRELPEVRYTVTTINSGFAAGKIYASIYVRLVDRKDRQRSVDAAVGAAARAAGAHPRHHRHQHRPDRPGRRQEPAVLDPGHRPGRARAAVAGHHRASCARSPAWSTWTARSSPTSRRWPSRCGATPRPTPGLNVNALAGTLRTLVAGQTVGNWRAPDGENYDVNVRLAPAGRDTLADLQRLPITVAAAADGTPRVVRLSQVADVTPSTGPNQINRRDLNREINIDANALGRSAGDVSADIRKVLDGIAWPPGYRYVFGGSTKNMNESFAYAVGALALAIVFIYMILASQFRSFLQPLALMSSLPLTLIGVVLALLMFRSTLNMFSIIGIVMLMGLVTKNAILLIDFAIRSRAGEHAGEHGLDHDVAPMERDAGAAARRPRAAAPDPDDDAGDGLRHGAAGLRADRRLGAARADGPGGDRRRDHLVAADAGGGAGDLLLPRRPGGLAQAQASRRARLRQVKPPAIAPAEIKSRLPGGSPP